MEMPMRLRSHDCALQQSREVKGAEVIFKTHSRIKLAEREVIHVTPRKKPTTFESDIQRQSDCNEKAPTVCGYEVVIIIV